MVAPPLLWRFSCIMDRIGSDRPSLAGALASLLVLCSRTIALWIGTRWASSCWIARADPCMARRQRSVQEGEPAVLYPWPHGPISPWPRALWPHVPLDPCPSGRAKNQPARQLATSCADRRMAAVSCCPACPLVSYLVGAVRAAANLPATCLSEHPLLVLPAGGLTVFRQASWHAAARTRART